MQSPVKGDGPPAHGCASNGCAPVIPVSCRHDIELAMILAVQISSWSFL